MNSIHREILVNGNWKIACDPSNIGIANNWFKSIKDDAMPAPVPGVIQQVFPEYHGVAWYWLNFKSQLNAEASEQIRIYFVHVITPAPRF